MKKERVKLAYDSAFQERIVRTLFQDDDWCIQFGVPHLASDHFENHIHRWASGLIIGYAKKYMTGIARDAIRIEARNAYRSGRLVRKRDRALVNALIAKLRRPVKDRSFIKRELFRFIKTQTLKDVFSNDIREQMKNNDVDAYDASLQRILDVQAPTEGGMGHFMVGNRVERYKRRKNWVADGIATGLEVDQHIKAGGPRPKMIAGLVAPPNVGKTTGLCHIAKQAVMLAQKCVLFVTLEESDDTIQDRLDSAFTGISINTVEEPSNARKIRKFWRRMGVRFPGERIVVKEFPQGITTVLQIELYIKSLERKGFYPDVVVVDYAGLLKASDVSESRNRKNDSRYEEIGTIVTELRSMAQRLKILVWTAFQGNRESMGKKVLTMKDLAESFKPAMTCDLLLAICMTPEEELKRVARMYSMKVRGGKARMEFKIRVDYERVSIVNR